MNRILVVGSNADEANALAVRLGLSAFESAPCSCETALALQSIYTFQPDAILLESSACCPCGELPRLMSKVSGLPIVVLARESTEAEQVRSLNEGAAEYLCQPVSLSLLLAHLRSALRWAVREAPAGSIRAGELEIDLNRREVRKNGRAVQLTPTEFRLLRVLAENLGRACAPKILLERVWVPDSLSCSHYLRLYVNCLRQKIEDDPGHPRLLLNQWGFGYRLVDLVRPGRAQDLASDSAVA